MENRAHGDTERGGAVIAIMPSSERMGMLGLAIGTNRAVRPADTFEVLDAAFLSGELLENLYYVHGILLYA
jgi:hypothetical protein